MKFIARLVICAFLLVPLVIAKASRAEVKTFQFESLVTEVRLLGDGTIPISVAVGDTIVTQFAFQPVDTAELRSPSDVSSLIRYEQETLSSIRLSGHEFLSPTKGLSLTSIDDGTFFCDCAAGADILLGPFDELSVSSPIVGAGGDWSISPSASYWRLFLQGGPVLSDTGGPFNQFTAPHFAGAVLPSEVATWNALSRQRKLTVRLSDSSSASLLLSAEVGSLVEIPEPASAMSLLIAIIFAGGGRTTRRYS
jgi:hypothetical protein